MMQLTTKRQPAAVPVCAVSLKLLCLVCRSSSKCDAALRVVTFLEHLLRSVKEE